MTRAALLPSVLVFSRLRKISPEAVAAVLHEDKGILHPGDLVEARSPKNLELFTLV